MQPSLDLAGNVAQVLRFRAEDHRYFVDPSGREIPGVTRALEESGLIDFSMVPRDVLRNAQERGTRVHTAIHYHEDGDLDPDSINEEDHGYFIAFLAFKNQMHFKPHLVEHFVHDLGFRWAGRVDAVGEIERKDGGFDLAVVDYKTGLVQPSHRIQVAAYASGLQDPRRYRRMTVDLKADGRFKVREYAQADYLADLNIFNAAAALWHWKNDNGMLVMA